MSDNAPGKHYRKGISLVEIFRKFPDDATAEAWFIEQYWPEGVCCRSCGSTNVQTGAAHRMPYRCRDCRQRFSTKTGTIMQSSKLGYQAWAIAIYLLSTSLKSVSSMKLHRDLEITQKSAWHLAHRIRGAMDAEGMSPLSGPVEVDETYVGGKRRNMPNRKRKTLTGRGAVGKTAVVGAKDRASNQVRATVVERTDAETLQAFVANHAAKCAQVFTDEASGYKGIPNPHETVKHSVGEYVREQVHTNGVESFWAGLKRAHKGTFHKMSPKHLRRYVVEFADKHNVRELDTLDQMSSLVRRMEAKRLRYRDLIADNGRSAGAAAG